MVNKLKCFKLIIIILIFTDCKSNKKINPSNNIEIFNVFKKDSIDDTKAIQKAINLAAISKIKLIIPKGKYLIDGNVGLLIPSNSIIEWEKGAVFVCIPNKNTDYRVINVKGTIAQIVENVILINPNIIGDRASHIGVEGEHGHGIVISNSKNVKIFNAVIKDCWGDGVAIYEGDDILIENLLSENNRRQGLTITSGKNITILNPVCININGTAPESGIDIEPNYPTDHLENIKIINPTTKNNLGAGITIGCNKFINSTKHVSVTIENHIDSSSSQGFQVASLGNGSEGKLTGYFKNLNGKYYNNKQNGIVIRAYSANNSPIIIIENPFIKNPNVSNQQSPRWGSGISIIREIQSNFENPIGNIAITNPTIIDTRKNSLMKRGIYAVDDKRSNLENVFIENPISIRGTREIDQIDLNIDGGVVKDFNKVLSLNLMQNTKLLSRVFSEITNEGANQMTVLYLGVRKTENSPLKFTNKSKFGLRIVPPEGQIILPILKKNEKYLETLEVGASITLIGNGKIGWIIQKVDGDWKTEK